MEIDFLFKLFWKKLSNTIEEAYGGNVNQLRSYKNFPSSCEPTVRQMHRQVNLGQDRVSMESYSFARTFKGIRLPIGL